MRKKGFSPGRFVVVLILFLVLFLPLARVFAASTISVWLDGFDFTPLHERWFWIREDPSYWQPFAGNLRITAKQTGGLPDNILLQKAPEGDFVMSTYVTFTPTEDFQMAGLVVYLDDTHHLTLGRAYCTPGSQCVGSGIYFDHVDGGSFVGSNYATPTTASSVYLRLIKNGGTYTGYYSENYSDWILIGSHTPAFTPDSIGLTAHLGGQIASEIPADFAYFELFSRVWQDDFHTTVLDGRWSWVREDGANWSLTANPGSLRITTQQGGLIGPGGDGKNLLLQEVPIGDYTLETYMDFKPQEDFNFAGLLVYLDDDHFLALGRAYCTPSVKCVGNGIYFDHESSGELKGSNFALPTTVKDKAYLRIVKHNQTYTGYYSEDGQAWVKVGSHTPRFEADQVGLVAHASAASTAAIPADFNYFKLRADVPAELFGTSTLGTDWSWIREDPTHWALQAFPGFMQITTQDGSLFGPGGDTPNLLLQSVPLGDFSIETATYFLPTQNFHNAGLLVYLDDDNYLKLTRAFCNLPPNCLGNAVYFDHEAGGAVVGSNFATVTPGNNPTYLRIIRTGGSYTAYTSPNGGDWILVGTHTPGFKPDQIGIVAGSSNISIPETSAYFKYFALHTRTNQLFLPLIWH